MPKQRKLQGGLKAREFYNELRKLNSKEGIPMSEDEGTFDLFRNKLLTSEWAPFEQVPPYLLEFYFDLMTEAIKKGIYGDEDDKALKIQNSNTGKVDSVYNLMKKVLKEIDDNRPIRLTKILRMPDKFYENLQAWRAFYELYKLIVSRAFQEDAEAAPAAPAAPQETVAVRNPLTPPERTKWNQITMGADVWYESVDNPEAEGVWDLPPGGEVVKRETRQPEPEPAPAPAPSYASVASEQEPAEIQAEFQRNIEAQIQSLPPEPRKLFKQFRGLFRDLPMGNFEESGEIDIFPSYMKQVNKTILKVFGKEMLANVENNSPAYTNLNVLMSTLRDLEGLEKIAKKKFPVKFEMINNNPRLDNITKASLYLLLVESELVRDLIRLFQNPAGQGKPKKKKLKGKAMPEGLIPLQQMAKESYNLVDPKKEINGWELKRWSPTLKFYVKGNEVIVAVRGTKANAPDGSLDVTADLTIPFNGIPGTIRYKRDKAMVENFQQEYPPSQYSYYGVGHSLGGAVIDSLIRDRLIREAVSYNPAIQFSDINRGLPNRRIYYGSDPLYKLMGWWDVKSEHREPENRTWADFLSGVSLPAAAMAALPAHNLSNFEGGRRVTFT